MTNENINLSDKLAIDRTALALDRTLLAWVRTSLSMITFGFTVYKLLQFANEKEGIRLLRPESPRNIGLFLEILGTVCMLLMLIEYLRMRKELNAVVRHSLWLNPNFIAASVVLIFGMYLIAGLILNLNLL